MYISLKVSCANGFKKWADTHQPEIKYDLRASGATDWLPQVLIRMAWL